MPEQETFNEPAPEGPRMPPPGFKEKIEEWRVYAPGLIAAATVFLVVRPLIKHELSAIGVGGFLLVAGTGVLTGSLNFSVAEYFRQRREIEINVSPNSFRNEIERLRAANKTKILKAGLKGGMVLGGFSSSLWLGDTYYKL
jgi:hypothetical protein